MTQEQRTPEEIAAEIDARLHDSASPARTVIIVPFIAAAIRAETEACAKVADDAVKPDASTNWFCGRNEAAHAIAAAIRTRAP